MVRQRDPDVPGSAAAELRAYLRRREIAKVWKVVRIGSEGSKFFYAESEPHVVKSAFGEKLQLTVLLDSSGKTSGFVEPRENYYYAEAPQSTFAKFATSLWAVKDFDDWNRTLAKIYGQLCQTERMEPLVKLALTQKLLSLAAEGSEGFRRKLTTTDAESFNTLTDRDSAALSKVNWLDSGTNQLEEKRASAEKRLARVPDLERMEPEATDVDRQYRNKAAQPAAIEFAGWISLDKDGLVVSSLNNSKHLSSTKAFVILKSNWIEIGSVAGDRIKLTAAAKEFVGWPVFLVAD